MRDVTTVFCPMCGNPVSVPVNVREVRPSGGWIVVSLASPTVQHECEEHDG